MRDPHQAGDAGEIAIGIDLGTTNSVVSCVQRGKLELIPDEQGRFLHPSMVSFPENGEPVIGMKARQRRLIDPKNTIFSAKRIIGQPFSSPEVQEAIRHLPYKVEPGENDEPVVVTRAGRLPIIDISSMMLQYLKERAEAHLGQPVRHCVVTVPAHFNDGQREATRLAAERAGLNVLRILNEPTAAALAYGFGKNLDQRIVVFDLGGGTFDVTVIAIRANLFEVVATGGDPYLGGDDMDRKIADIIAQDVHDKHGVNLADFPDSMARLLVAGEQIKTRLSQDTEVKGTISDLAQDEYGQSLKHDFHVTRTHFLERITPLLDRALAKVGDVLAECDLTPHLVDQVILVGGATRVPAVRKRVASFFQKEPRTDINPMQVVSAGSAVHASSLATPVGQDAPGSALLMDVTSHGLGVGTAGGYTDLLVKKNTQIPVERTRVFTTSHDNQTVVDIQVCEGESKRFGENHFLGTLRLEGLQPASRGQTRIEVSFLLDADGILQVSARDMKTGRAERATLRVSGVGKGVDQEP